MGEEAEDGRQHSGVVEEGEEEGVEHRREGEEEEEGAEHRRPHSGLEGEGEGAGERKLAKGLTVS